MLILIIPNKQKILEKLPHTSLRWWFQVWKYETVVVWKGIYTNKVGADKAILDGKLVMQWDTNLFSVEDRGEDSGYYINHSCESNLWMNDAYTLIAKIDINEGDEITADYALWEADLTYVSNWNCNCTSELCRKKITGLDWKLKEVQDRYVNHFSPLINKELLQINS